MKKLFAQFLAVLAIAFGGIGAAHATSDCTSTIAYATEYGVGTSPAFYVMLTSNVGFYIAETDPSYKSIFAMAMGARMAGDTVTVTFLASNIVCNPASFGSWRNDMTALRY